MVACWSGAVFSAVDGVARGRIARLNADGSLDTSFLDGLAGVSGVVQDVAVQSDGRILVAGQFSSVNGVGRSNLARLNADGSLDTTFLDGLSGLDAAATVIAIQSDGKILVGGTVRGGQRPAAR